uniref:Uncharacterized protein n=1 Tax=Glossina palpalis gambiensis TaxID=67801 RepID=A0A1B0C1X7_9MUSC
MLPYLKNTKYPDYSLYCMIDSKPILTPTTSTGYQLSKPSHPHHHSIIARLSYLTS